MSKINLNKIDDYFDDICQVCGFQELEWIGELQINGKCLRCGVIIGQTNKKVLPIKKIKIIKPNKTEE